jgi:hypothetical protein
MHKLPFALSRLSAAHRIGYSIARQLLLQVLL